MTSYAPTHTFIGGDNPPLATEFNANLYAPDAYNISTLYDYTRVFGSLDMINGWLDYTLYNDPVKSVKIKDRSCTRIYSVSQNANLDIKSRNTTNDYEWFPIPGLCLTVNLPWPTTVLIHYNCMVSNFSRFESGSGVQSPQNANFGFYLNGSQIKPVGKVRPGVDVVSTSVWGPAYRSELGADLLSGSLQLRLPRGIHDLGIYYRDAISLMRLHSRSIQAICFRRAIG